MTKGGDDPFNLSFTEETGRAMEADDYLIDHSGFDWEKLLSSWEWLLEDDIEVAPWLMNRFGDVFFTDELGIVNWLNITDGELTEVAASEAEFMELLQNSEHAEDWFQIALVDEMSEAGERLAAEKCYGFKTLPILGGDFGTTNIKVWSIVDYWNFCGRIHVQLDGLPDGTEVDIDIPEL